jgi:hypothetical protein
MFLYSSEIMQAQPYAFSFALVKHLPVPFEHEQITFDLGLVKRFHFPSVTVAMVIKILFLVL